MTELQKPKRIVDKELLKSYHSKKCIICGEQAEPAHIRSRGAGGDDVETNLLAVCRRHHTEQHRYGWSKFVWLYPVIGWALEARGWVIMGNGKLGRVE